MRYLIILCFCMIIPSCMTPSNSEQVAQDKTKQLNQSSTHVFFKKAMGTRFTITIVTHDQLRAHQIARVAFRELDRIEQQVSSWIPSSEISVLNQWAGQKSIKISEETYRLLAEAQRISILSESAFDVTWASLKGLWDFRQKKIPTHTQIKRALRAVGYKNLVLKPTPTSNKSYLNFNHIENISCDQKTKSPHSIRFLNPFVSSESIKTCFSAQLANPHSRIDLGGIAKGYAIDALVHVLRHFKYKNFLVDGGGDLYAEGLAEGGKAWRVGIQHPRSKNLWASLQIPSGYAVVSSGDYERFFIQNKQRYHHIIDLRTGYPAQASVASTVMATSAVEADAWATALFVLGSKKGINLLNQQKNIAAIVFTPHGQVQSNLLFKKYFPHHSKLWKQ